MDVQTDVGHINLIGGLVTRNPPNKSKTIDFNPVKSEFDWTNRFRVRVQKQKYGPTDRQTDGRRTHQSNRRVGYMQPA